MERRGDHGVETIAAPQEVKWASSKACRAKNLQVSAMRPKPAGRPIRRQPAKSGRGNGQLAERRAGSMLTEVAGSEITIQAARPLRRILDWASTWRAAAGFAGRAYSRSGFRAGQSLSS